MRRFLLALGFVVAFTPVVACAQLLGDFEVAESSTLPDGSTVDDASIPMPPGDGASDGSSTECTTDRDCPEIETVPPNCAVPKCNIRRQCVYGAVDRDKDNSPTATCSSKSGRPVDVGNDCDDDDPKLFPGASVDCAEQEGGLVSFPGGSPKGECRIGKRTCLNGKISPCVGVIAPKVENCGTPTVDEDCDGSPVNGCPCTPLGATQNCDVHPGRDGIGVCKAGAQKCEPTGWSACSGSVGPGTRDCTSPADNDCSGQADNKVDTTCKCAVTGVNEACNQHVGKDGIGVCVAGTRKCVAGVGTSDYTACTGDVGPTTDDCDPSGNDLNCDGIKGNGSTCTREVNVFVKTSYTCTQASSARPYIYLADSADPAAVPNGFVNLTKFKLFIAAGGGKIDVHRCYNNIDAFHFVGYGGCGSGATDERVLGYASPTNGGNGWVELKEWYGKDFGPTGVIRSDDSFCCSGNCNATGRYTLK